MVYRKFIRKGIKCFIPVAVILGLVLCWASFILFSPSHPTDLRKEIENEAWFFLKADLPHKQRNETYTSTIAAQLPTTLTQSAFFNNKYNANLITNTTCVQHYFLLILVSSAPSNVQRRKDIRRTWGVDTAIKSRWKTVFLVAQTQIQSESDSLLQENDSFGDLVRADYFEHYWNQTLKIQMGFEWAARYCNFSYLLKADDDSFVNSKGLISLLSEPGMPQEKLYMGELYTNNKPFRGGKWKVSYEEYNRTYYPDFCPGFGIVLSSDVVHLFVDLFQVVPKFRLDDVYIGLLAEKAGVKPVNSAAFSVTGPSSFCVPNKQYLVWHGVTGKCLFKLFQDINHETT